MSRNTKIKTIPATKPPMWAQYATPPPPPLDHFTVYDVLPPGPDGPPVTIVDQWQTQDTDLGLLNLFLVPADKIPPGAGIGDPISHLACHEIPLDPLLPPGIPPSITAIHQFGPFLPTPNHRTSQTVAPSRRSANVCRRRRGWATVWRDR